MRSNDLRSVFRRVLALGLIPPAALVACGGGISTQVDENEDGGTQQTTTTTKDGGRFDAQVVVTTVDASVVDAHVTKRDAMTSVDAHVTDAHVTDAHVVLDAGRADGCIDLPSPPPPSFDASGTCSWTVPLPCALSQYPSQAECQQYCGVEALFCLASTNGGAGDESVLQCVSCAIGRRPEGFVSRLGGSARARRAGIVGRYFETAAELEAASVSSFERLERELEALGAPADLRRRARSAAEDERRHARVTSALATRFGAANSARALHETSGDCELRDLYAVALENAVEGCVRETFGALTATLQAERATDPRVRAAMRRIASDETAHAALAWSIASWISTRLDADAQAQVRAAITEAIAGLARELDADPPIELRSVCGLPTGREASAMLDGMRELLWAA